METRTRKTSTSTCCLHDTRVEVFFLNFYDTFNCVIYFRFVSENRIVGL